MRQITFYSSHARRLGLRPWLGGILVGVALALLLCLQSSTAQSPPCGRNGTTCPVVGGWDPISVEITAPQTVTHVTSPGAPAFGALIYDPDFKRIEREARTRLKRGLELRQALSPYQGKTDFATYVKKFDYQANWEPNWTREYTSTTPYTETLTLIGLIDRADQDLREARDLYAYLLVYAPEYRFRGDSYYTGDPPIGYSKPLCGETDQERPDPTPDPPDGTVLPPEIDWCNFRARLRQSVREAANLRLIFGQQFVADALGLHFSGTEFYGGEEMVRQELAQLRAAKHQYELAEQGLTEALGRAVGSGCYVSDFYTQSEWSLLSRAIENQEMAQHHIAIRLSYLDIDSPETVPQAHAAAQGAFRQASMEGYIKLIGMASLGAAQPLGVGCNVGERPDGLLAAEMAANLLETRRKSRGMTDGRNVFGFEVTFTPARPFENTEFETCEATGPGERGLWDEAWCAAEYAKELQNDEVANSRAFDDSQKDLQEAVEGIRQGIDARITAVSGCSMAGEETVWRPCVEGQIAKLETCMALITSTVTTTSGPFDACMDDSTIKNGEAKQALYDLRAIYVNYLGIKKKVENIDERIQLSDERNTVVASWLRISGDAETAALVSQATLYMADCLDPSGGPLDWVLPTISAAAIDAFCGASGGVNIAYQAIAGHASTDANIEIEDAEHHKEIENLLLDQSELLIEAYAAIQQYYSKLAQYRSLLDGLESDMVEARRQRAYFQHSPANDPSFRIVRDSARMVLAKQLEYAARMSYLAARRAEYEYAARLSASNFRISDIYRARTADDIKRYLQQMRNRIDNLPGGVTNARDLTISVAQHLVPADMTFQEWVAEHTVTGSDGKDVLRFSFPTSLLEGGLFSRLIQQNYDGYWLHKLSGIGEPKPTNTGVSLNLVTTETGLSFRETSLSQGGLVHLRSQAGCVFDYRLIAPAALLGLEWAENQDPETAIASFLANVNDEHDYAENGFRAPEFMGRAVSSTDWEVIIYAGSPDGILPEMDLEQLTDIELIFSTTYASRSPGEPELSECTRIDW